MTSSDPQMLSNDFGADVSAAVERLSAQFVARNPASGALHEAASDVLPGGNTRSVLHYDPFPLTVARGEGAYVEDVDGHRYLDCVGEFSAGLYGHSEPAIREAIIAALDRGLVLGAPNGREHQLAAALRERFPSMELMRFCNSGTEANLYAIATAKAFTGRNKVIAFREAYHGGVLVFAASGNPLNVPHQFVLADYNDADSVRRVAEEIGDDLAAIILEPMLGAGGNLPATTAFLAALRDIATSKGALLIFDEVKTSRLGAGGLQGRHGVRPDLTTLGKYLGGGLSFGAFGGRADIMARFAPGARNGLKQAGTFNNNPCSMAAGLAGITQIYTAERAERFNATCEAFRDALDRELQARDVPMRVTGYGSIFSIHFGRGPFAAPTDFHDDHGDLRKLLHLYCALNGLLVCARGDLFLSLPMTESDRETIAATVLGFAEDFGPLLAAAVTG